MWAKFILFVSIPQGPLLFFFAKTYPNTLFIFKRKLQYVILGWVLLNLLLASVGLIFKGVTVVDNSVSIQPGPLIPSFGILHTGSIIAGLSALFRKYRASKGKGSVHVQLAYVFFGIFISFTLTFLITFILPIILKNTVLLAISPLFLALSVVVVAYAIVSQKLFDIRSAVARSVAYVLSLGFIGLTYGAVIYLISVVFSFNQQSDNVQRVIYVALALITAVFYPSVKKFFARITTKIFYQDAYDPQVFLDNLNKINFKLIKKIYGSDWFVIRKLSFVKL